MLIGRLLGWIVALLGLFILFYSFSVPAFVATPYILGGVVVIAGGVLLIYLFRNKKKSIEKEARRQAEIEKRKREVLEEES
ncbi:MAG: hypothetical protein GDA35_08260 [Hyphomonadaceae bacterium]|nr:hypothetical protein [Hyphomonadaceae bacterium]